MKHIKGYKIFESHSETQGEIIQYLRDIFQELKDIGFSFKIETHIDYDKINTYWITVRITYHKAEPTFFNRKKFKLDLVKDYIESANDYMESVGWKFKSQEEWDKIECRWLNFDGSVIQDELKITYIIPLHILQKNLNRK